MNDANARQDSSDILANASGRDGFAAIADPEGGDGFAALLAIAAKIGRTRRPGALSAIPAGATYLAQFVVHDLDFRSATDPDGAPRLDLALIYGDGPRHDAFAYQVPAGPGEARSLLRIGRTRPTSNSPAWGATRDLPRAACPHLDAKGVDSRTDVLVPNSFSDSNLILGQVQTLWVLLHNAVTSGLSETHENGRDAFEAAQRITRHIYREAVLRDVLGAWVLPWLRPRYVRADPQRLSQAPLRAIPRAFKSGVARIGHSLVREIYAVNDARQVEGLRDLIRHTSTGRPGEMPLTEDWLIDFARFFDIGDRKAQRARGIGPHVARPFALGGGVGLDAPSPSDGLVLRDLVACSRSGAPSIRTLVARISATSRDVLEGCFAQDERKWRKAVAEWLSDTGLSEAQVRALAKDPPLTLFLMLEAEADAQGQSLGAVGSVLMAETLTAALPDPAREEDLALAREAIFHGPVPVSMAEVIVWLQDHYTFAEGARLLPSDATEKRPSPPSPNQRKEAFMLDARTAAKPVDGLVEVADYIELGRLIADWTKDPETRPETIAQMRSQLDGIARVPDNFEAVQFVEGRPDVLVIRLPERTLTEQSLAKMETLVVGERYMLPKFYDDIYSRHFGPQMSPLETFLARIGDYTIAQCQ